MSKTVFDALFFGIIDVKMKDGLIIHNSTVDNLWMFRYKSQKVYSQNGCFLKG